MVVEKKNRKFLHEVTQKNAGIMKYFDLNQRNYLC